MGEPTVSLQRNAGEHGDNRLTKQPRRWEVTFVSQRAENGTRNTGRAQGIGDRGTTEATEMGFWQSSRYILPGVRHMTDGEGGEVRPKRPTEGKVTSGLPFVDVTHRKDIEP